FVPISRALRHDERVHPTPMSRVYQAIQQAVREGQQVSTQQPTIEDLLGLRSQEIPRPHRTETAAPQWIQANGKRSRLNLGDLTREEEMKLVQRVFLLPVGSFLLDHPVPVTAEVLRSVLKKLRSQFAYVLVHTPPINHYADVPLLGQCVDGIVLVMEANSTRREAARKAKDSLDAAK